VIRRDDASSFTRDVVDAVKFLFNNKGVNGVNLIVDGGWTASMR